MLPSFTLMFALLSKSSLLLPNVFLGYSTELKQVLISFDLRINYRLLWKEWLLLFLAVLEQRMSSSFGGL